MPYRQSWRGGPGREQPGEEQTSGEPGDGLNVYSRDDDDEDGEGDVVASPFTQGEVCWQCQDQIGKVGVDPTCHGQYGGDHDPIWLCYKCLPEQLKQHYNAAEGIAVVAEPFGTNNLHLYYRLDEMPAYQFPREDIEPISWLLLTIGDECVVCGEQSHYAWLSTDFIDPALPEDESTPVFRNLEGDVQHLCGGCTADRLASRYEDMRLPLIHAEVPRSAMGLMMPSKE
jgi:hypothetical protein